MTLFADAPATNSQTLGPEIRGYRVHRANIRVHNSVDGTAASNEVDAKIKVGKPYLVDVSLAGLTFEVPVEASPVSAAGTIDFLTFQDFKVNGIPVEIDEYPGPIVFKKGDPFTLPRPARVFISSGGVLESAWDEFKNSKTDWTITGLVLAFGKFRKLGLKFKRVVPIDISVSMKNPFVSAARSPTDPTN